MPIPSKANYAEFGLLIGLLDGLIFHSSKQVAMKSAEIMKMA
ncbi:MAG: hypothetical protein AB7T74_01155 [Clostridia bacterium]|jgi:hypothetical protein